MIVPDSLPWMTTYSIARINDIWLIWGPCLLFSFEYFLLSLSLSFSISFYLVHSFSLSLSFYLFLSLYGLKTTMVIIVVRGVCMCLWARESGFCIYVYCVEKENESVCERGENPTKKVTCAVISVCVYVCVERDTVRGVVKKYYSSTRSHRFVVSANHGNIENRIH